MKRPSSIRTVADFEFYYLAELTRRRIKPLSRFEKKLPGSAYRWLKHHGLSVETTTRKTLSGREVVETIFSTSAHSLNLYQKKFGHTLINLRAEDQRLEGSLFGYPSCCVEQFIRKPYSGNDLCPEERSLLFHWACNGCRCTKDLIPSYRKVHQDVSAWYDQEFRTNPISRFLKHPGCKAAAALMFGFTTLSAQGPADSLHHIPLSGDPDMNGLTYPEEVYLGAYGEYQITHDCQLFAMLFKDMIDALPDTIQTGRPYRVDHMMRGVVSCPKCGLQVNMGYLSILHPLRDLQMDIPYLGLHFLEKGFFSYGPDQATERIDIDTLKRILYPYDPAHCHPVEGDTDLDGLTDAEEDSLWMEYTTPYGDFNNDGVPDGAELAEELIRLFPKLNEQADGMHSSIKMMPVYGSETCQTCGSVQNMGYIEITNPENNRTFQLPFIALHAMAHGSFAYDGTIHQNQRSNVVDLYRTMKTHMLLVGEDSDNDGLKDHEAAYFNLDPENPDSDGDGIPDGMEVAIALAQKIDMLPTEPQGSGPWIEYLGMDGIHLCSVCGEEVIMGVRIIHNPAINSPPLEISNYSFHFLQKGSFACEGAMEHRIDPVRLSEFTGFPTAIQNVQQPPVTEHFKLLQNHPNPFSQQTKIAYELSNTSKVRLRILNVLGQEVCTLVDEVQPPGSKSVSWDGTSSAHRGAGPGFYIFQLTVDGVSRSRKMLFLNPPS